MTLEQMEYGFDFVRWLIAHNIGIAVVGTTGGEPTLHPMFWTEYMPRLRMLRTEMKDADIFEIHTNGSSSIHPLHKQKYRKFFRAAMVGHDMCHRMFASLSELNLQDLTDIAHNVTIRQNEYFLERQNPDSLHVSGPTMLLREKGRAAESCRNGFFEKLVVTGYPKLTCSWHEEQRAGDCLHFTFTPDHVNHCGEKSHPLPPLPHDQGKIDEGQFWEYGMDFNKLMHAALDYTTKYSGVNCSQKCHSYFCQRAVKPTLPNVTVTLTEEKKELPSVRLDALVE